MSKVTIRYTDYFAETMRRMREDGLLLTSVSRDGKPNVMTIGWGTIGSIWGRPVWIVLVRPSRYSYSRLEEIREFTVNVPGTDLNEAVAFCGKVSGRDRDKFREAGLSILPARQVRPPAIEQCVVHYECRTIHFNDLNPDSLPQAILDDAYPQDDFHRIYYGEIVAAYADPNAAERLAPADASPLSVM